MVSVSTSALREALALLLRSPLPPLIETAAESAHLPARGVGQVFQAKVVAALPNARCLIDVEGVRLDVKLPIAASVGDTLQLEIVALDPRLTFTLVGTPAAAVDRVAVSESVRNLAAVLERVPADATARPPSPVPVLASVPEDTAVFAESLKAALARSGMFYESHQAQWVAGQRPLESLMQEPQASLTGANEPIHPGAMQLVRHQLEVLDTRQLVWNGQVWPDQSLEWRIEEEPHDERAPADATAGWKTSLRLELPRLGEVSATLTIRREQVHLAFSELGAEAKAAVKDGQVALAERLANAGLSLVEMRVDRDET